MEGESRRVLAEGIGDLPPQVDVEYPVVAIAYDMSEDSAVVLFGCHVSTETSPFSRTWNVWAGDVWTESVVMERHDGEWQILAGGASSISADDPLSHRPPRAELGAFVSQEGGGASRSRLVRRLGLRGRHIVRYANLLVAAEVKQVEVCWRHGNRRIDVP